MRAVTLLLALALAGCKDSNVVDSDPVAGDDSQVTDADGDGFPASEDCDDEDDDVNPGEPEVCDGVDNDCDGEADEDVLITYYEDADADGFGDNDRPFEACQPPQGYSAVGNDCNDGEGSVYPGAPELCDGLDNNCDGQIDEAVEAQWYADSDGDGYGDEDTVVVACEPPEGFIEEGGDCDDGDASINPDGQEVCDGDDNDCDGLVDDEDSSVDLSSAATWYADNDSDGYGSPSSSAQACDQPNGYISDSRDCDDGDANVNPAATEVCNGVDDDCDALVDDDDNAVDASAGVTLYRDRDGDGYGEASTTTQACASASGYVSDSSDCDDSDSAINPAAQEVCDGDDNDCDGLTDDADSSLDASTVSTWYDDDDGDGYGDSADSQLACTQPNGYVSNATDCDDSDSGVNPGEAEICDGVDNDCDNLSDDDDSSLDTSTATTWYDDSDSDGYGDPSSTDLACTPASGYIADNSDCDDTDSSINPGASELCFDSVDNDCDASTDEGCSGSCGDSVLDSGEEYDPPPGPFSTLSVDSNTCRWDFSGVNQLYCNGGCSWSGSSSCDQTEADLLCQFILDNPNAYATSWTATTALPEGGFPCTPLGLGTTINVDRGQSMTVSWQDTSILANHGAGDVVAYPVCAQ